MPTSPQAYLELGLGAVNTDPKQLYIDLMKRVVTNIIYEDQPIFRKDPQAKLRQANKYSLENRVNGEDFPSQAHSMVGIRRLEGFQYCIEQVIANNIPGDIVEAGTFQGGAAIFIQGILNAHKALDRDLYVCDQFESFHYVETKMIDALIVFLFSIPIKSWRRKIFTLFQKALPERQRMIPFNNDPSDKMIDYFAAVFKDKKQIHQTTTKTTLESVKSHFARYGLLSNNVVFVKGSLEETLPKLPSQQVAVIILDASFTDGNSAALTHLYPKLSIGGYCISNDYADFPESKLRVDEYRRLHNITEPLQGTGKQRYWQKLA